MFDSLRLELHDKSAFRKKPILKVMLQVEPGEQAHRGVDASNVSVHELVICIHFE